MSKSALMTSAAMPQYRNDAEAEEKKALEKEKSEGEKPEEKSDAAKADAEAGQKLDRMLSCLDSMSKRMDALEESEKKDDDDDDEEEMADKKKDAKRKDEWPDKDEKKDAKRKDAKKDAQVNKIAADDDDDAKKDDDEDMDEDDDKAKRLAADKKKDSRKDSRADSELIARLDRLERMRSVTDEDRAAMAQIQSRADSAYTMLGDAAPRFMDGEEKNDYRIRLLKKLQPKSPKWKDYDFAKADSALLDIAEKDIYADAVASAMSPADLAEGHLRMIKKVDETGRPHILWAGQPRAWMQQFQPPTRRVTQFETRSRPN